LFENVYSVFYNTEVTTSIVKKKTEFLQILKNEKAADQTNFVKCFEEISTIMNKNMKEKNEFYIVFFTDGQETINSLSKVQESLENVKTFIDHLNIQHEIQTSIYSIGFSRDHDAQLLNQMAQAGTQMGNFIFVDPSAENYDEQIKEALNSSINMALESSTKGKIVLKNGDFKKTLICDSMYEFKKEGNILDPQNMNLEDAQIVEENKVEDWTSVKYHCSTLMKKSDLVKGDLMIQLNVSKDVTIENKSSILEVQDVPLLLQKSAEVQLINKQTFELIQ